MKCTAHRQDGNPCTAYAIKGGSVCRVHGGSAPQVRAAALRRLLEAVDPAAGELIRIGLHAKQEAVRVQAIKELFARAGFGEPDKVEISLAAAESRVDAEIARLSQQLDDIDA